MTERTFGTSPISARCCFRAPARFEQTLVVVRLRLAPVALAPIDASAAGIEAAAALLQERRGFARQRQRIIAASPELQERELIKLASLAAALAGTLRDRGVPEPAASLTAEVAIAVFKTAFERWVDEASDEHEDFPRLIRDSLAELKGVTAGLSDRALA